MKNKHLLLVWKEEYLQKIAKKYGGIFLQHLYK